MDEEKYLYTRERQWWGGGGRNSGYEHDRLQAHIVKPFMTYLQLEHILQNTLLKCYVQCALLIILSSYAANMVDDVASVASATVHKNMLPKRKIIRHHLTIRWKTSQVDL